MALSPMAQNILNLVRARGHVSFAEMAEIDGFAGNRELFIPDTNIVLWQGISEDAAAALNEVRAMIVPKPCSPLIYMVDGCMLALPVAKSARSYKKPRWLPVTFSIA